MVWSAPFSFLLNYGFNGNQTLGGTPVLYQINITVQNIPTAWSLCMTQDRGANTDTLAYTASADVTLVLWTMGLNITGITNVSVNLEIHDLTTGFTATLGDGFLDFVVTPIGDTIGSLLLEITETTGFLDLLNAFADETIVFFSLELEDIPSFLAEWFTGTASPPWNFFRVTTASLPLGAISAAMSSEPGAFLYFGAAEVQKAQLYHNDSFDLGSGFVMEASLWVHFEDLTRAEVGFGGDRPTVMAGLSTSVPHSLHAIVELANNSALNPINPPGPLEDTNLSAILVTTDLPAVMDFNITLETNFTYAASDEIDLITARLRTDEALVHVEIEGIPADAEGDWDFDEDGFVRIELGDRLDRIEALLERPDRLIATDFRHVELLVLDVPESVEATWDVDDDEYTLNMLDATYDDGLGEFRFLGTDGDETTTTNYLNALGVGSACMTKYSAFTSAIDSDYWPATVPGRLDSLHCRHPTLDTVADDYAVQRDDDDDSDDADGAFANVTALRVREVAVVDMDLSPDLGFVTVEFSRNLALARQLYGIMDDVDDDEVTLVEVSNLPDGLPTNSIHGEWDLQDPLDGHLGYSLSETVDVDLYNGPRDFDSETTKFTKAFLDDAPASVSLDWVIALASPPRTMEFDFIASSVWELGILFQDEDTRYVAWIEMQSLTFDFEVALPGEEACSFPGDFTVFEFCYRVFRLDTTLDAVGSVLDGLLGIYRREGGLENLDSGEVADGDEYIPEWAFMMDDFDVFEVHVLWDVGAAMNLGLPPSIDFSLLPSVNIVLNVGAIVVDYFWNSKVDETIIPEPGIPGPSPFVFPAGVGAGCWSVTLKINTVKDYVDQNPIHLLPLAGASLIDDQTTFNWIPFGFVLCDDFGIDVKFDVPGFHRFPDHPTLFP